MAEDACGALEKASTLNWQSSARFVIWIADAPSHGLECNGGIQDNYAHNPGKTVSQVVKLLCDKNVDFMFCRVNEPATKKMEQCLQVSHFKFALIICRMPTNNTRLKKPSPSLLSLCLIRQPKQNHMQRKTRKFFISHLRYHFVFVLDESGSMSGTPWQELEKAYREFKHKRTADQVTP